MRERKEHRKSIRNGHVCVVLLLLCSCDAIRLWVYIEFFAFASEQDQQLTDKLYLIFHYFISILKSKWKSGAWLFWLRSQTEYTHILSESQTTKKGSSISMQILCFALILRLRRADVMQYERFRNGVLLGNLTSNFLLATWC